MHSKAAALYPICRSITGPGLRETLDRIGDDITLERRALPSGQAVFDWTIPDEWAIRDAWIKNAAGERVVDFKKHNLHVLGYSEPFQGRVTLDELKQHCFTLPEQPDRIPYRTSYYKRQWGFCLTQRAFDALTEPDYEVCIDSTLAPGVLDYGQCVVPGTTTDEIIISAHVCHPSLANDNLSGVVLAMQLARELAEVETRYTYRFIFAPGTIGAIAWLSDHEAHARAHVRHGLILACVGDSAAFTYKQSRRGNAPVDRAAELVLGIHADNAVVTPFSPYGYDERQYCSPGFNLPVGCLMRSGPGGYHEYHTSGDTMALLRPGSLARSFVMAMRIFEALEGEGNYVNTSPDCEPQLGKRGLYSAVGGRTDTRDVEMAMLWVLNQSDGQHSLIDIALRAKLPFAAVRAAADALLNAGLLAPAEA